MEKISPPWGFNPDTRSRLKDALHSVGNQREILERYLLGVMRQRFAADDSIELPTATDAWWQGQRPLYRLAIDLRPSGFNLIECRRPLLAEQDQYNQVVFALSSLGVLPAAQDRARAAIGQVMHEDGLGGIFDKLDKAWCENPDWSDMCAMTARVRRL